MFTKIKGIWLKECLLWNDIIPSISNIIFVWNVENNKCIYDEDIRIGISSQTTVYDFTKDSASSKQNYDYVFSGNALFMMYLDCLIWDFLAVQHIADIIMDNFVKMI